MEEVLGGLGLSPVEIKVYLGLLRVGESLAGELAKKAEVNRSNCYDALERLIEKGLVSYVIKENRKYFRATNFNSLLSLVEDKRAKTELELQSSEKKIRQIIPQLERVKEQVKGSETIIYETKRGIRALLDGMLRCKEEIVTLGVAGEISSVLDYYLPRFHKERIHLKIPLKIILSENLRKSRGKELKKMKYTFVKFLPEEYCSASTTNIYGNNVAIMLWSEKPLGILIENKTVADSYRKQFNLLWKIAIK